MNNPPTIRPLLLDTHALLWYANDAPELPAAIKAQLDDERTEVCISIVNFWELATLTNVGRIVLKPSLEHCFSRVRSSNFRLLAISDSHLLTYAGLPQIKDHRALRPPAHCPGPNRQLDPGEPRCQICGLSGAGAAVKPVKIIRRGLVSLPSIRAVSRFVYVGAGLAPARIVANRSTLTAQRPPFNDSGGGKPRPYATYTNLETALNSTIEGVKQPVGRKIAARLTHGKPLVCSFA